MSLPQYQCIKVVGAAKIIAITNVKFNNVRLSLQGPEGEDLKPVEVRSTWVNEKKAEVGGYLVEYKGGYLSFSPADVFEEGYELIPTDKPEFKVLDDCCG